MWISDLSLIAYLCATAEMLINCISVCYTGNVNCVAAESLAAGDIVVPSVDGFKKSLDGNGVGIVIRGGNANSHIEVLLKTI